MNLVATPWQTVGPFFSIGLDWPNAHDMAGHDDSIEIEGLLNDGDGNPVMDGMIELWQADGAGRYAHPADRQNTEADSAFRGFGRCATTPCGFRFRTIKPGRVPFPRGGLQAPHILVGVMARGLLRRLTTRLYFADEPSNAEDPILALVPPERRNTLLAKPEGDGIYRFDIRLQGPEETVFFAW